MKQQPRDKQGKFRDWGYHRRQVRRRAYGAVLASGMALGILSSGTLLRAYKFGYVDGQGMTGLEKLTRSVSVVRAALGDTSGYSVPLQPHEVWAQRRAMTGADVYRLQKAYSVMGLYAMTRDETPGFYSPALEAADKAFRAAEKDRLPTGGVEELLTAADQKAADFQTRLATAVKGLLDLKLYFIPQEEVESGRLGPHGKASLAAFAAREDMPFDPANPLQANLVERINSRAAEQRAKTPDDLKVDLWDAIHLAAKRAGGNADFEIRKAVAESGFDPLADNRVNGIGAFQFVGSDEVLELCYKTCDKHGFGHLRDLIEFRRTPKKDYFEAKTPEIEDFFLSLRAHPEFSAAMGVEHTRQCVHYTRNKFGFTPTEEDQYGCTYLGMGRFGRYVRLRGNVATRMESAAEHFAEAVRYSVINAHVLDRPIATLRDVFRSKLTPSRRHREELREIERRAEQKRRQQGREPV